MAQSNPIYSHDLYHPGPEDQLKLLHARLAQLQLDIKNMTISAKGLKTALGGLNVNNGGSQKQIIDLARKVEQLNRELERTKQARQKTQQEIERTRLAEERRLAQSIKAEGALSREIDRANERRAASNRRQQAHDQQLEQRRVERAIAAKDRLSRAVDQQNERRAASTRKQQASDQALDQKRIASAQRVADNQRRINAGIQSNAQKTAAAIANMNALNDARIGSINQSRGISQARANAQAAIQAQRLTVAQNQASISTIRLSAAQKRAAQSAQSHSGTLKGMLGSIRSMTYAYFSLAAVQQIVGKLFSETKALNTLDIALKQTLGSIQAVTEAKQFLLDITERYGADLLTTSNAYLKFGTAAKQAGVSAQDTRNIFESITKASSVLGLGAERTSYVFLALEQIMSKGRLSTEELRRQLGEHLPGAFGIAAKAMNVTTAELTDMLKKGKIASTDFLPKFAKELERTYGIDTINRVDNLAAAQGRFNNEITLLIRDLDVAGFFKDFFDTLASGVKFVRENVDAFLALGKAIFYVGAAWVAFKIGSVITGLKSMTIATTALNAAIRANPIGLILSAATLLYGVLSNISIGSKEAADSFKEVEESGIKATSSLVRLHAAFNVEIETLRRGNLSLDARKKLLDRINTQTREYGASQLTLKSNDEEILRVMKDVNKEFIKRITLEAASEQLKDASAALLPLTEKELQKQEQITKNSLRQKEVRDAINKIVGQGGGRISPANEIKLSELLKEEKILKAELSVIQGEINSAYSNLESKVNAAKALGLDVSAILSGDETGGGGGGGDKSKTDPRLEEIDRLRYLNSLKKDSLDQNLEAVKLAYDKEVLEQLILLEKKKINEEQYSEAILLLKEKLARDLFDVETKHYDHEIQGLGEFEDEYRKKLENIAQFWVDFYQGLRDGSAKEMKAFKDAQETAGGIIDAAKKFFRETHKETSKAEYDIFSLLGINFDSKEQKDAAKEALDYAKDQLTDFLNFQKEIIDQQIEDADRLVRAKEEALNRQVQLAAANQANNVAGAQAELALAKKTQEDALKQRQRFQKTELALNTALEASNLGVAIAKTLAAGLGLGGIALVALMLGAFAAAKIKAFQLVNKKTFRGGGFEEIKGGSHESGNDTHVGGNNWAEKDESVGIFNKNATKKYKPTLKAFVNAANKGTLDKILFQDRRAIQGITNNYGPRVDTSVMEKRLGRLVSLTEKKSYVDGSGNLVINDRGRTTIVRNGSK